MWLVLGTGWHWMLEVFNCSFNVSRHGYVTGALGIIPGKGEAQILFAFPVNSDRIQVMQGRQYMFSMLPTNVFDAEVINDKGEKDWMCCMAPETGSVASRSIVVHGKVYNQAFVCNQSSLG